MKQQIIFFRFFIFIVFSTTGFIKYGYSTGNFSVGNNNALKVNDAPNVTLTTPVTGSTYLIGENIYMSANASDPDGFIVKVMFYAGNTFLGEDVSEPYEYTWLKPNGGNYAIAAKAIDNDGDTTTSNVSNIVVIDEGQPAEWKHSGLGGGGALFSPSISPFDDKEIYIVCDPATEEGYLESLILSTIPDEHKECINSFLNCSNFSSKENHKAILNQIYKMGYPNVPYNFSHPNFDNLKNKLKALLK